eukprot:TRINITY_DN113499_c0_g1_i1.p1 TRINITY_DN113499_c0_g1~~TRINITY_DN113499_c0_g1_i1.p1  ORF type:complete len:329 (+),score=24.25 TRINITY_DN113499_c0_g1_i1:50-1036(+)
MSSETVKGGDEDVESPSLAHSTTSTQRQIAERELTPENAQQPKRAKREQLRILDVRDYAEFEKQHIQGSYCIPVAEIGNRTYELPTKHDQLHVVARDEAQAKQAVELLTATHYGWKVGKTTVWDTADSSTFELTHGDGLENVLWAPCPHLSDMIDRIESQLPEPQRTAVDLGCGCGRDTVFLARRGWKVVGLDNRACLINRVNALAENNKVGAQVSGRTVDLVKAWPYAKTDTGKDTETEESQQFGLVICVRFLIRTLFPKIADLVAPGGFLLYQHFVDGCTKPSGKQHLLDHSELAAVFSPTFDVVHDTETTLLDGRPVCNFLARKK